MSNSNKPKICSRCILPEAGKNIVLDSEGVCNVCHQYDRQINHQNNYLQTDFEKILQNNKGKGDYDCMVMCSGGKDSTLALYYMVKKFKLRVLAFTFDHGFENRHAIENVENATNKLGVDWLYFKTNFMKDAFRAVIESKTKTTICHICSLWYFKLSYDTAATYKVPIIIAGWRKEQSSSENSSFDEYEYLSKETKNFIQNNLRKIPKYKDFPLSTKEATRNALKKQKITALSPHWFIDDKPEDNLDLLKRELNWKQINQSYPLGTTNCQLNFPSVFLSIENFGFSHYTIEMSKRIRNGEVSRQKALKSLKIDFDKKFVNSILKDVGCKI